MLLRPRGRLSTVGALCLALLLSHSRPAAEAAELVHWNGGGLAVGGYVSASTGVGDQGWFNETEYSQSLVHLFEVDLTAEVRGNDHIALLSEFRTDNLDTPSVYALYLRLRPFSQRSLSLQLGRIPPVFGAFPRRLYAADNPLIGYPLAYQYLTTLRADSVPSNANQLLALRGNGWDVIYPVGDSYSSPGLPVVSALRWDTGVEARLGDLSQGRLEGALAVTQGTLSNPLTSDSNGSKQVSLRLAARPFFGTVIGVSAARGAYLSDDVTSLLPRGEPEAYYQKALGVDAEWSHGYWIVRGEGIYSQWDMPVIMEPAIRSPLKALATFAEARYKIRPGLYAAVRLDRLGMSDVTGSLGPQTWDADVRRVEAGFGYAPRRGLWLKVVYQHDWRDGGYVQSQGIGALQASYSF